MTAAEKYEYDNGERLPFFWLGADASKLQWYYDSYEGMSRRMHIAMQFPSEDRFHKYMDSLCQPAQ